MALPLLQKVDAPSPSTAPVSPPVAPSNNEKGLVPVLCGMCRQSCPLLVRVDGQGRLEDISGNPASPLHGGKLCSRALAAASLADDPDRLRYPMKRNGKRGAGSWQRISWQEALDTVASKLYDAVRKDGPQSVGLFCGRSSSRFMVELCRQLGIDNIAPAARNFCLGDGEGYPLAGQGPEMASATGRQMPPNLGLFFGCHLGENINIAELREILALKDRAGRIMVCDPRFSVLAGKADWHLALRPGSDATIIFGWLRLILDQNLQQAPFAAVSSPLLVELRRQLEPFTIDFVARQTDIDAALLTETGGQLADPDSLVRVYQGRFAAWYGNDSQRLFAIRLLSLVLDSLHLSPSQLEQRLPLFPALLAGSGLAPQAGGQERRESGNTLLSKMFAETVQTVGVWGSNPFHCYPNPYRTAAAFKKAGFVFCCDLYPTEAALYADIILPEACFLESRMTFASWRYGEGEIVGTGFAALSPPFECKEAGWIVDRLGRQFGTSLFDDQGNLLRDKVFLAARGLAPDSFDQSKGIVVLAGDNGIGGNAVPASRADGEQPGAPTDQVGSGTPEQAVKLPSLLEVPAPPPGFARLFSGRLPVHTGSSTQNNSWLDVEIGENELWLNDRTAASMGLAAGEKVHLINQDGIRSITPVRVKPTPGIRADCVYTPHGFGCFSPYLTRGFARGLADGSLLTRGRIDAETGRPGLRCNFVRLVKAGTTLSFPSRMEGGDTGTFPLLFGQDAQGGKG